MCSAKKVSKACQERVARYFKTRMDLESRKKSAFFRGLSGDFFQTTEQWVPAPKRRSAPRRSWTHRGLRFLVPSRLGRRESDPKGAPGLPGHAGMGDLPEGWGRGGWRGGGVEGCRLGNNPQRVRPGLAFGGKPFRLKSAWRKSVAACLGWQNLFEEPDPGSLAGSLSRLGWWVGASLAVCDESVMSRVEFAGVIGRESAHIVPASLLHHI